MTPQALWDLAAQRNRRHREVIEWLDAEGAAGRLKLNSQAPAWSDYVEAQKAFTLAAAEVPES